MISQTEIETYAVQIAKPDFDVRTVRWLIGHLDSDDRKAVLMRAAQIEALVAREAEIIAEMALEKAAADQREADLAVGLLRLARASGCPDGVAAIPWMKERGLIEEVDGQLHIKPPNPKAVK